MDKRLLTLLIIIALGVWANFLATIFPPAPIHAYDVTDVNIQEVGGKWVGYGGPISVEVEE